MGGKWSWEVTSQLNGMWAHRDLLRSRLNTGKEL